MWAWGLGEAALAGKPKGSAEPSDGTPAALRDIAGAASTACDRPITVTVDRASFATGAEGIDPVEWCRQLVESVAGGCTLLRGDTSMWTAWKAHPMTTVTCRRDTRYPRWASVKESQGESAASAEVFGGYPAPEAQLQGTDFTFGYFAGSVNLTNATHDVMVAALRGAARNVADDARFTQATADLRAACGTPDLRVEFDEASLGARYRPAWTEQTERGEPVEVVPRFDAASARTRLIPLFELMGRLCTERPEIEDRVVMPAGGTGRITRPTRPFPVEGLMGLTTIRVVGDDTSDAFRAAGNPSGSAKRRFQEALVEGRYDTLLRGEELDREGELLDAVYPTITASGSTLTVGISDMTWGRPGHRDSLIVTRLLDLALSGR